MHYVVLASHSAEVCPTSNAKTKSVLLEVAPQIPGIADKHGVNIVAGPFANREHTVVVIVETDRPEALDTFLVETQLTQWNTVRILPSIPMEDAMREIEEGNFAVLSEPGGSHGRPLGRAHTATAPLRVRSRRSRAYAPSTHPVPTST